VRSELSGVRSEVSEVRSEIPVVRSGLSAETRRHFDFTAEALRHDLGIVAEGVAANTEALGRLRADMQDGFEAVDADSSVSRAIWRTFAATSPRYARAADATPANS
jgi:hypothetical protein